MTSLCLHELHKTRKQLISIKGKFLIGYRLNVLFYFAFIGGQRVYNIDIKMLNIPKYKGVSHTKKIGLFYITLFLWTMKERIHQVHKCQSWFTPYLHRTDLETTC
jgi:hypothetical protein